MEKDAKFFKVYDARNGKLKHTVPPKNLGNSGAFIAADYIDSLKLVATTSNNNAIDFWDAANYQLKMQENTPEIQLTIKWCSENQMLYSAGCDRQIHCYDVNKESKAVGGS
jgi:WD40 repeat protein